MRQQAQMNAELAQVKLQTAQAEKESSALAHGGGSGLGGEGGHAFRYTVNGETLFLRGANWVPPDAFEARVTPALVARHFAHFTAAGFSALRVWGGGGRSGGEG